MYIKYKYLKRLRFTYHVHSHLSGLQHVIIAILAHQRIGINTKIRNIVIQWCTFPTVRLGLDKSSSINLNYCHIVKRSIESTSDQVISMHKTCSREHS